VLESVKLNSLDVMGQFALIPGLQVIQYEEVSSMKNRLLFLYRSVFPALSFLAMLVLVTAASPVAHTQGLAHLDRDNARAMLSAAKDDLKKNYYDPALRGMDLEARFKEAEEQLKQATTRDQLMIVVAQTLLDLNDSHTFFLPPTRAARVKYGWEMQVIGEKAFVVAVKPKSDAEAKGLKEGDEILAVDGYRPTRDNMWKMYYRYYALMPARSIRLLVKSPGQAEPKELNVEAKIERGAIVKDWEDIFVRYLREGRDVKADRLYEFGNDLLIWKMTTFEVSETYISSGMNKAKNFKTLILDLRGNGGGYVDALERLAGYFFDHDVKIADLKGRKEMKPIMAKTRGANAFKGELIVLVDSESGSASEIFARLVQLEKRGRVIGDRTAGSVMTAKHYDHQIGVGSILYFGNSITVGDTIMTDGKSLERAGVMPDIILVPTGEDLAAKRDPVLSHAAKLAGVNLDPEKAGTLFPKDWKNL
jgi:carboxyl-terminal processing protease